MLSSCLYVARLLSALFVTPDAAEAKDEFRVPTISLSIQADGTYILEGAHYKDGSLLQSQLERIVHRHPRPNFVIVTPKGTRQEAINRAIGLFHEAGVPRVGLLIEPRNPD